jgi:hypothetical protein
MQRQRLEQLEEAGFDEDAPELLVSVVWVALEDVPIDEGELRAARRRAMLVLAAGGDPHRDVGTATPAVERLADELDAPERRASLHDALAGAITAGLPTVQKALQSLLDDPELAWRLFALAHVADELSED